MRRACANAREAVERSELSRLPLERRGREARLQIPVMTSVSMNHLNHPGET